MKKKRRKFADTIGLALGMPAGFDPMRACFKRLCLFGKGTKWTPSQNWGNLLLELHVPFFFTFFFFNQYLSTFVMGSLYPQQMHAYYALH